MSVIEKFLGKKVVVPDDLKYVLKPGFWAGRLGDVIRFGLTEPALVLLGGVKEVEGLVEDGGRVEKGETALFAITGKILYLDAPLSGSIRFNREVLANGAFVAEDPYGDGWLFEILARDAAEGYKALATPEAYLDTLMASDGLKNPDGVKGGVSGMCKAVYSGIAGQSMRR